MNKNRRTSSLFILLFVIGFFGIPFINRDEYLLSVIIRLLVNISMAVSLRIIFMTGQLNICHATFMGIGAYVSALLINNGSFSPWLTMFVATGTAALLGLIVGLITLRLKEVYFFFVTFALGEVFRLSIGHGPSILGGYQGLNVSPFSTISIPGLLLIEFSSKVPFYYIILFIAVITLVVAYRMDASRYGLIFRGIDQNDLLAGSIGINIMHFKLLAFVLSCTLAGLIGWFWAHYFMILTPDSFGLWQSIYFLVYIQVGGAGSIFGPIVGAFGITMVREIFRFVAGFEPIIVALALIMSVYFLPNGLIGFGQAFQIRKYGLFPKKQKG